MSRKGREMPGDNQMTIVVKSTAGTWPDARFNRNNKAQKVLDDGIHHFHLEANPSVPYVLSKGGQPLALGEKLGDLRVVDADVVTIEAGQPVDA
jgi:hypothetical protein